MEGWWEKTRTHAHSNECTYIYTSRFVMCVVAGKWCHYDAGISEFCMTFHVPEKGNRPGIPLFFFFFLKTQTTQLNSPLTF